MLALSIESAFECASIAIGTEDNVIEQVTISEKRNVGKLLIPSIKNLLDKSNTSFNQIDVIFADFGPGSFTGIRIAGIIVKTIFYTVKKKYFGLCSLEIMTYTFLRNVGRCNDSVLLPVIDAKSNLVFIDTFKVIENNLKEIGIPSLTSIDEFLETIEKHSNYCIICCDETLLNKIKASDRSKKNYYELIEQPTATDLLYLGFKKLISNENFIFEPLYLRRSYAEEKIVRNNLFYNINWNCDE